MTTYKTVNPEEGTESVLQRGHGGDVHAAADFEYLVLFFFFFITLEPRVE